MSSLPRILYFFSRSVVCAPLLAAVALLAASQSGAGSQDDKVHVNQIQVIGSHNSYHIGMGANEMKFLRQRNAQAAVGLDYSHPALDVQFNQGIRQIELDVFSDAKGGRYSHPAWPRLMRQGGLEPDPDFDPQHLFDKPGFKVMHVQDLDYRSNCEPFTSCLQVVRSWSQAHPNHLPLFLLIETKEGWERQDFMTKPEPFTTEVFDALDAEIRSVFHENEIITPDRIRGNHSTLEEAVLTDGWPTLREARGKVIFLMDQRKARDAYIQGHPSLRGRIIFTNALPGEPDAAFVEVNDPQEIQEAKEASEKNETPDAKEAKKEDPKPSRIPELIKKGYLVRTRTDADLVQARKNDTSTREAAMASGAQMLSTDFPFSDKADTGYAVDFPQSLIARCNPVSAPSGCKSELLEPHMRRITVKTPLR
ncbi:MAG TPA: phosphatidylinositol-specific phospholipase C1-like protein [Candidatus Angelobacter sp.]|nr:phosphatidylinositol-specific phospholipase C1-like protein [Candidatus Angelobacter sp.]